MAVEVFANMPMAIVISGGTAAPASGTTQTWTVTSSLSFPSVSVSATPPTQCHVADISANSEIILVTNISGGTWTVTRGAEGTTPVAHVAGFTVYQVTTAGFLNGIAATGQADLSLLLAPSGATGETFPRTDCGSYTAALTSGTTIMSAIPLGAGVVIGSLGVMTGSTAPSGVTHGWLALTDSARIVRAVTADQTSTFGTAATALSLPAAASYTVPTAALYYLAANCNAATMGTLSMGVVPTSAPVGTAPILAGTSNTAQTTPPAVGSTLASITASGSWRFYGYTS